MRAIGFESNGPAEVLKFLEIPKPAPRPHDLLVKVDAFSVNPVDVKKRSGGNYNASQLPGVLGFDAAGTVVEIGSDVKSFSIGDRVYFAGDLNRPGSNAEYVAVDERVVGTHPRLLNAAEAAAVPLVALTAWEGLFDGMNVPLPSEQTAAPPQGKVILVTAGAGGVGSFAIQLAKWAGLTVIATASRPDTIEFAKRFGTDHIINHHEPIEPQLKAILGEPIRGGYLDYVFVTQAPDTYIPLGISLLRSRGRIVTILGTSKPIDIAPLFRKSGGVSFEYMNTDLAFNDNFEKQGVVLNRVSQLLDSGVLKSGLHTVFDWSETIKAHKIVESNKAIGKVVLQVR